MDRLLRLLQDINPDVDFINEKKLVDDDLIDSLDVLSIVIGIEDAFGIKIDPDDVISDNFNSAEKMYEMINRYK